MLYPDEKKELVKHFSGRSRKALLSHSRLFVPKKYDNKGRPVKITEDGKLPRRHVFELTLREATFLKAWKENAWDFDKACEKSNVDAAWAQKFSRSLDAENYRQEDERDEILSQIPTKTWITARYTAAGLGIESPSDDQKWGIDRVKEVVIPKTTISVQINNVLQMPALTPDQEASARKFFDAIADEEKNSIRDAALDGVDLTANG